MMRGSTIVDATLISAPSSTKNAEKKRDPEMHQTKKGNQWHFGMKCHTGMDAGSGFVHTVEATAANVHDVTVASKLLRKDDEVFYGDSAYLGLEKRDEIKSNPQLSTIEYRINCRPGRLPQVSDNTIDWERTIENRKSAVRYKVEHPYRIEKNIFGFRKAVYRGLRKNLNRLHILFASANLYMLARAGGSLRPAWASCGWERKNGGAPDTIPILSLLPSISTAYVFVERFNQRFLNIDLILKSIIGTDRNNRRFRMQVTLRSETSDFIKG